MMDAIQDVEAGHSGGAAVVRAGIGIGSVAASTYAGFKLGGKPGAIAGGVVGLAGGNLATGQMTPSGGENFSRKI